MNRRLAVVFSALALLISLGVSTAGATALPARSAPHSAEHTQQSAAMIHVLAHDVAAATVPAVFCSGDGNGYCLNRNQCGGAGAAVIMWTHDHDNCEDFVEETLHQMCGNTGQVTSTCPFTVGSGLNDRYKGAFIIQIRNYNEGSCLATNSAGQGTVGTCPGPDGNGGANGTIFIWNRTDYVVNRYWSNLNYAAGLYNAPAWMCSPGAAGQRVILNDSAGSAGSCQWSYGP